MKKTLMLFSIVAVLGYSSCHSEKEKHGEEEAVFLVTSPLKKDTTLTRDYVCQIHSMQHIELRAMEKGYLEKIYIDEGQFVRKGQPMFQIMPMLYEAEMQKAQAEVNFAEIEYKNTKALADSNIVSQNELALVKAKLDKANAELALAKVHLDFTEIKAPFDGIMDRFHVRLGSMLEEGELLTELSDNSKMWVYFNVPEAEYLDFKSKMKKDSLINVKLLMANRQIFEYPGVVTTIEADFNNETGNIAFRATFPNPKGLLRHGETGSILMETPARGALLIPQKATFEILDKKYVFVVEEDNSIKQREITVSAEINHIYLVTAGLEESDKILLEGLRKVRDGDEIAYKYQEPDSVITHLELYAE